MRVAGLVPFHRLQGLILAGVVFFVGGCATGRTDFRIIKVAPQAVPTAVSESEAGPEIPSPPAEVSGPPAPAVEPLTHRVEEGESLWRIARRLLGDPLLYPRIAERNRIPNPDLIHPGQVLLLERGWARAGDAGLAPAAGSRVPPEVSRPRAGTVPPAAAETPPPRPEFPRRENRAFAAGEKLLFSVEYFGLSAGFATLSVEPGPVRYGRPTWRLVATARTHPAFEWFFKVRDRIVSILDAGGLFSWQYEKHLREGSYANDSVILYDQLHRQVIKDEGRTVVPAQPWTQDVLSEFYFFRSQNPAVGETVSIPVVADDGKAYEVLVKVLRRERVNVPAGSFQCLVVEPALKFEGLFQQKGQVNIWLTDDVRKVPVLIKSKIIIGTIDIVLREAVVVEVE